MIPIARGAFGLAVHPTLKGKEASLLEALLACTDYGVLITTTWRQDILCNLRFGEIFDIDPNEAVLWTPDLVRDRVLPRIKEPTRFLADLQAVYADPDLERVDELELARPDQVIHRHTSPLLDADGRLLGRVWTFLDITPLKNLQRQVEIHSEHLEALVEERTRALQEMQRQWVENEKLAAVGMLAATVAHDVKNILTPLQLELSALPVADPEAAEAVQRQVQRLTMLTHRLLSLSRPPRLEVSRVDLRRVWADVDRLVRSQAEQGGCRLSVLLADEPILVEVNAEQVESVFVNLALNALTAMSPTGGVLTVEIAPEGDHASVRFTDTGPGIPQEIAALLFQPFVTGRPGGTGLGLHSSRRILQEHGGAIGVQSGGRGATFWLQLPLARPGEFAMHQGEDAREPIIEERVA